MVKYINGTEDQFASDGEQTKHLNLTKCTENEQFNWFYQNREFYLILNYT